MKKCSRCKETLPLERFRRRSYRPTGLHSECRKCGYERVAAYKKNNPDRAKKYLRASHLRFTYGISVEDYEKLLELQDGKCAICGEGQRGPKKLAVDHDHRTGAIRGILCAQCNTRLGWMEQYMAPAVGYLSRSAGSVR